MSVELDGTLIDKAPRIAPDDHDFGVSFQWFMTCSAGTAIKTKCARTTVTTRIRVSINQNGKLRMRS
jgi:hypothetical protein